MQVRYIKRGLFIMLKFIDIILITIGAYLLMISGIILDMEISCGIENIPKSVAIKLTIIFIIAIICTVGGIISAYRIDEYKTN